jgi:hypothetical protein
MPITPTADPLDEKRITGLHLSVWLQAQCIFNFVFFHIFTNGFCTEFTS